jgi:hypothetical protein
MHRSGTAIRISRTFITGINTEFTLKQKPEFTVDSPVEAKRRSL